MFTLALFKAEIQFRMTNKPPCALHASTCVLLGPEPVEGLVETASGEEGEDGEEGDEGPSDSGVVPAPESCHG
jgi:hypothetical protein